MPTSKHRYRFIPATLIVLVGIAVAASPDARRAIADALMIAGIRFNQQATLGKQPATSAGLAPGGSAAARDERSAIETQGSTLSLAEAMSIYRFDVPRWAPPGFDLDRENVLATDQSIPGFSTGEVRLELTWHGPRGEVIHQTVSRTDPTVVYEDLVGPDGVRQIEVGGKLAALVTGAWDADTGAWSNAGPVVLSWRQGNDLYELEGEEVTDLIAMAQSMPHFK